MTDQELREQFQMLAGMMERMATKDDLSQVKDDLSQVKDDLLQVREEIKASETRTKLLIENQVTKRIDTLLDGYKLTHEKQYELERRMEQLEQIVRELQARTA